MPKQIIIAEQHHLAAVFWEDQIQELVVATGNQQVGDIYLGVVENVIPGIDAAFVNIGDAERNGFIHVTDLGPLRLRRGAGAITELLTPQQKVLVQVMKEPTGNKGPRLTGNITLPGRYLVLMPYGKGVNLSRRIRDENERSRLRALAILIKPSGMGLLVRTEAEGKAEEAIMEDLEFLQQQWELVQQQANSSRAPALLNRDDDFIQRVLRDMYSGEVNRIVVDEPGGVKRVKQHLMNWSGGRSPEGVLIDHHRESSSILDYFRINAAIREALKPRVDLPSGGYIIMEPTEALTVIDVNSGSFTRSATARETVLWTNSEAAVEIARQLRLRNIGGVIIVDFIDMDSRRDQLKLLEHFNRALKSDKARPQIAQLSELGLVELTRKRQGQNLYELFGHACPQCGGLGHLAHLPGDTEQVRLETPSLSTSSSSPSPSPRTATLAPMKSNEKLLNLSLAEKEDETASLDLLHHPSYQGQGGRVSSANNSRRRRRRKELGTKDDYTKGSETVSSPSNKERERERSRPEPVETKEESFPIPKEREEKVIEKVSIEMSEFEQDVYALMGISPLVRLDRKIQDSKAVVISVRLPGEPDLTEDISDPDSSSGVDNGNKRRSTVTKSAPKLATDVATMDVSGKRESGTSDDEPPLTRKKSQLSLELNPSSSPETSMGEGEDGQRGDDARSVRRRRRRSSAQETSPSGP